MEVVLPTPPFWLATTMTRVASGRGDGPACRADWRASTECSAARASGVVSSSKIGRRGRQRRRRCEPRNRGSNRDVSRETTDGALPVDELGHPVDEPRSAGGSPDRWIICLGRRTDGLVRLGHVPCLSPARTLALRTGIGARPLIADPTYLPGVGPSHPNGDRSVEKQRPTPSSSDLGGRAAQPRPGRRAAAAISSATELPFIATSAPSGATSGIDQPSSRLQRSHRPRGHHVEACAARAAPRPGRAPPRRWARPSRSTTSVEVRGPPQQRLDQGDRQVGAGDRQHQARAGRHRCRCRRPSPPRESPRPGPRS